MKFGTILPIPTVEDPNRLIEFGRKFEEQGYDSVWAADHTLMQPKSGTVPETWSILNALGQTTDEIKLSTCVTCVNRYHPAVLAQRIASIDRLTNGRVCFGLGPGEIMNLKPFGLSRDKPVTKMIEGLEIMKELWQRSEDREPLDFDGEYFKCENAFLQISPEQSPYPPVYIGANGPRTRKLTGKLAEGWVPSNETPELYRKHYKDVKEGIEEENRSSDDVDTALWVYTAIDKNRKKAIKAAREGAEILRPKKFEEAGYDVDLPSDFKPGHLYEEFLVTEEYEQKLREAIKSLPEDIITDFCIVGTPNDVREKIEDYVDAGVNHFVFVNLGPDPKFVGNVLLERVYPSFQ